MPTVPTIASAVSFARLVMAKHKEIGCAAMYAGFRRDNLGHVTDAAEHVHFMYGDTKPEEAARILLSYAQGKLTTCGNVSGAGVTIHIHALNPDGIEFHFIVDVADWPAVRRVALDKGFAIKLGHEADIREARAAGGLS